MRFLPALVLICATAPLAGHADTSCDNLAYEGQGYTVCRADAGQAELRLWLRASSGEVYGTFERLEVELQKSGESLAFAMNAGMYHPDRKPVGLYVEDGDERARLVTRSGPGNFGMLPNGVFCVRDDGFRVIESRRFAEENPYCRHATQSGPMLVIDGGMHPRFLPDSRSRYLRNGVGVSPDGQVAYFAISDQPVTFHDFARLFRDHLGTPNALYFDGNVSRLHAPLLGRSDGGRPMGPIIGAVRPVD